MDFTPTFTRHAGGAEDLVQLDPDHPGFRDRHYRERRDRIARLAFQHRTGSPVSEAPYTVQEQAVWRRIREALAPVHQERVCREILELQGVLPLPDEQIPQLEALNPRLHAASGFRMEPVAGLARQLSRRMGAQSSIV